MNKSDVKLAKAAILKCLTTDFYYGVNKRTGAPLKRRKRNRAEFDRKSGRMVWSSTSLTDVMDAVVLGLYLALADSDGDA